jgi:hypothetical protein
MTKMITSAVLFYRFKADMKTAIKNNYALKRFREAAW